MPKVRISSVDSFSGEFDSFDTDIPAIDAPSVVFALRQRLAETSEGSLDEVADHRCLSWVQNPHAVTEFAFAVVDDSECALVSGLVLVAA